MALWMDDCSVPKTESELADLDAIAAIKYSAALEFKRKPINWPKGFMLVRAVFPLLNEEKGNEYVKKGKNHYSDAIDCYTRAINQKALSDLETSTIFSNRAHVNLLLGNYRRALLDAEEAIKLAPSNIKALYRAAKASLSLNMLDEAKSFCEKGLAQYPENDELKKLTRQIDLRKSECEQRDAQVSKALTAAKGLVSAIKDRGLKLGKAMFQELTGVKRPIIDKDNILHWPVLLLYAEVMTSDFIEDFCETDMFSAHLDLIFDGSPPLLWDKENAYTRDAVELFYEASSGVYLSKKEIIRNFLEGTAASHIESFGDDDDDAANISHHGIPVEKGSSKWVKVNEKKTLHDVLREPNFVIPGIPVFYVVSKKSSFYKKFKSGNWSLPS